MRLVCELCNKEFVSQEAYEIHMIRHEIRELVDIVKCMIQGIHVE